MGQATTGHSGSDHSLWPPEHSSLVVPSGQPSPAHLGLALGMVKGQVPGHGAGWGGRLTAGRE